MAYEQIRNKLNTFYFSELPTIASQIRDLAFERLDTYAESHPSDSSYQLKAKQYEVITDLIKPVLFEDIPFFFETGVLTAFCDGSFARGNFIHANGWLYRRNEYLFKDADPYAFELYSKQKAAGLYIQCGIYTDRMHLGLPFKKVFSVGLKGILEELKAEKENCKNAEEADFIDGAAAGIRSLCRMAEKFAAAAKKEEDGRSDEKA